MSGIKRYLPGSNMILTESALHGTYVSSADHSAEIARLRAEVEAARKALRKIRARADSEGTGKQHGPQYVAGLRNAANMIEAAMGADA